MIDSVLSENKQMDGTTASKTWLQMKSNWLNAE